MQPHRHSTTWAPPEEGARYERGRPGYPDAARAVLTEHLGIGPGSRVADVAAGTGKLTRILAGTGAEVVAVEPMPGMRDQLVAVRGARVVAATAERLPVRDGGMAAVTVAQAFHWFQLPDAAWELRRILRPGGRLAVVTNLRDPAWSLDGAIGAILARYEAIGPRPASVRTWREGMEASGAFTSVRRIELPHEQRFERMEDFDARFTSISFVILLDDEVRRAMLEELRAVVAGMDPVVIPLRTVIDVWAPTEAAAKPRPGAATP